MFVAFDFWSAIFLTLKRGYCRDNQPAVWASSICPSLRNSDHAVISVSIYFPFSSKEEAPIYHIAFDYSSADWNDYHDHIKESHWEDIFDLGFSDVAFNFCEWFWLKLMYIPFIESIRSSLIYLHSFQLLELLPMHVENTSLFVNNIVNLLCLKFNSGRLVIIAKRFLNLTNSLM